MTKQQSETTQAESLFKERPLITFALFGYNQELFIREAIEGAFLQTYQPLEIILSDDCSTDDTFAVMQEMAEAYKGPHKVILNQNKKNLRLCGHINQVVDLSSGDYIVMAAGDDVSLTERVDELVKVVLQQGELGGVFGRYHSFSGSFADQGNWEPVHAVDDEVIRGDDMRWVDRFEKGKSFGTPGCVAMWNRKLFDQFGGIPDGVVAEDVLLGSRALFSGLGVGFTSAKTVQYRHHEENCCAGVGPGEFARKDLFTGAVVHKEALVFRQKCPDIYPPDEWDRIVALFETSLFKNIILARSCELGWLRSGLAYISGLKHEAFRRRMHFLKRLWRVCFTKNFPGKRVNV